MTLITKKPVRRVYAAVESVKVVSPTGTTRVAKTADRSLIAQARRNGYEPDPEMLLTEVRAISARVNQNFDGFPSQELKKSAHTFVGRPVFVNHNNEDHKRTRGMILASEYRENGSDKYINLLIEIDAKKFPKLAAHIASGELDSVSMGTDVEFTRCSYCHNTAYEVEDFCDHVRYQKGKKLSRLGANGRPEKVLVYESCHGLNFFEISYVFDPADETAINQRVYLPRSSKVANVQKSALGEVTAPDRVDTLRKEGDCPVCKDPSYNGKECDNCQYVAPPDGWGDPKTEKSQVLNRIREQGQGKEGAQMGNTTLNRALARRRLEDAQAWLKQADDAELTTEQARTPDDSTDVEKIDSNPVTWDEAREPDSTEEVTDLVDPKSITARRRAQYIAWKRRQAAFPDEDPQAAAPADSDGPNSGPPAPDADPAANVDPAEDISSLPIDWKQDESGQPYGNIQGTDLDIFVNEDMTWQVLPEGSNDPIAEGQGSSYEDCVTQAFDAGQGISSQADPSQNPEADPAANAQPTAPPPGVDPNDPTKQASRRKKADGETPEGAKPDARVDVEELADHPEDIPDDSQYNAGGYANNAGDDLAKPDLDDPEKFSGDPWNHGDKKASVRRTSAVKAVELAEAYIDAGIVQNNRTAKFKAVAEFEKLPAHVTNDRLALLSLVEKALPGRVAASMPRQARNQGAQGRMPNLGNNRPAQRTASSANDAGNDYLMALR